MLGRTYNNRSWLVFSVFICFSAIILTRLFSLQCLQHSNYRLSARNQHQSTNYIPPQRGGILDCRGNILAASIPSFSLYCVPREIPADRIADIATALAPVIEVDETELRERLTGSGWFVWLKRHLSATAVREIKQLDLPGLALKQEMKRVYPKGSLLSQVLGFTDPDGNGLEGMEWKFDRQLRGHPGWLVTEKDSKQREISWFRSNNVAPIDGCNLFLTIDEVIQAIAEEELDKVFKEYEAKGASLVVMEPSTGRILALANRPTYDPNRYTQSEAEERRNRVVADQLEPGSTFKVFPAAAALEAGLVASDTEFYCEDGSFQIGGRLLRDSHPHGVLRFDEILQKSSNIGMAKVGMILGRGELYRFLRNFGIGRRTGIELPGEASGCLHEPRSWSKLSLRSITMGHEVSTTPLGLLTAFSALGNGGVLLQPRILDRIESPSGEVIYRYLRKEKGRVVSEDTARKMLEILRKVVMAGGTGRRAFIPGFQVAGKTGTAQKLDPGGGYSHSLYYALFMGLFPAAHPRVAILVVVDEPHPYYYGGVVSAPVFKEVAERIIRYLDLEAPEEIKRS
ncbi:MAG: penicillin-binding protein 2 [Candidatus Euphemobacter frigidus]|nr:penicillin-binding protein 2 [Candidatus Euphemobacter frigidus]MDP8275863.1 penicillin-binding protein 2 [Candidatus Euphemobacter frigidus]